MSYRLAAMFAYFSFRRSAVMSVMKLVDFHVYYSFHFFDDTRPLSLFHQAMAYNSAYFHPPSFDRFLDVSILAWNAYHVRSMISVNPPTALQCNINETMILITARLMKSHGFLVSISSDEVHHTVMILSFRTWVIITSTLMTAIQKKAKSIWG